MQTTDPPYQKYQTNDFCIELNIQGSRTYEKLSYPLKTGVFSRFETKDAILEFNPDHTIRNARLKTRQWIHPSEWLKRTFGNDWIYYSSGGYAGVFEAIGEYYLPNLTYTTNSLLGGKPFLEPGVYHLVSHWYDKIMLIRCEDIPNPFKQWINAVKSNPPQILADKAKALFDIIGSRVTVLPPDARHVDYNIIPIHISDGCLYKCRFCRVKNKSSFKVRTNDQINTQISRLKKWFNRNLINQNAVFLGEHDALAAPSDIILNTAQKAFDAFGFSNSYMSPSFLFLFGSVDALMSKPDHFYRTLNRLPYQTYINVGLESCEPDTIQLLGKPLSIKDITAAFDRIKKLNLEYSNIEISCNFVMDDTLPKAHIPEMLELLRESVSHFIPKGSVYLSPLSFGKPSREVLYDFYRLKTLSRFPTFLYIIQRF